MTLYDESTGRDMAVCATWDEQSAYDGGPFKHDVVRASWSQAEDCPRATWRGVCVCPARAGQSFEIGSGSVFGELEFLGISRDRRCARVPGKCHGGILYQI